MASNAKLVWSLKNGDMEAIKTFVTAENVNCDLEGRKPIHIAADFGQNEAIKFLLLVGADVDALDSHGLTALLTAVYEGHTETVRLLLLEGAKKDSTSPDGRSYVECADKPAIRALLTA